MCAYIGLEVSRLKKGGRHSPKNSLKSNRIAVPLEEVLALPVIEDGVPRASRLVEENIGRWLGNITAGRRV